MTIQQLRYVIKITDKDGKININAKKLLTEVLSVIFLVKVYENN